MRIESKSNGTHEVNVPHMPNDPHRAGRRANDRVAKEGGIGLRLKGALVAGLLGSAGAKAANTYDGGGRSLLVAVNRQLCPRFPDNDGVHAKAPDACSGLFSNSDVRDTWGPVSFVSSCNTHDTCYYNLGSSWEGCNEQLRNNLRKACEDAIPIPKAKTKSGFGKAFDKAFNKYLNDIRDAAQKAAAAVSYCYTIADGYYAGVQAGVAIGVYNEAQKAQYQFEKECLKVENPVPPQTVAANRAKPAPAGPPLIAFPTQPPVPEPPDPAAYPPEPGETRAGTTPQGAGSSSTASQRGGSQTSSQPGSSTPRSSTNDPAHSTTPSSTNTTRGIGGSAYGR